MALWPNTHVDDNSIFACLNVVMLGYFCLVFLPRWRHTPQVTLVLALIYSTLYAVLLFHRALTAPLPPGGGFDSLDGVVALFADRPVVLAGWTHYIAFDLMMSRHIVMDSMVCNIPHLAIVWTVPLTLMAGPAGLVAYYVVKVVWIHVTKVRILQFLYCGATFFSLFMVVWILVGPASWRVGFSDNYDNMFRKSMHIMRDQGWLGVPPSVVLKYAGHRAIQFTHTLPGAVWAAAVPIQLHPGIRNSHRKLHRKVGYAFFAAALSMMIGFVLIEWRGLDFVKNDFPSVPLDESTSRLGFHWIPHLMLFRGVAALFLVFAGLSLRSAIRRDFVSHRKWILRHIGMGLWIAPQRIYALASFGKTPREQKANFGDGTFLGLILTVLCAELAVWLLHPVKVAAKSNSEKVGNKVKGA